MIGEQKIKGIRIVKEGTKLSYANKKIVHIENPRVSIETIRTKQSLDKLNRPKSVYSYTPKTNN